MLSVTKEVVIFYRVHPVTLNPLRCLYKNIDALVQPSNDSDLISPGQGLGMGTFQNSPEESNELPPIHRQKWHGVTATFAVPSLLSGRPLSALL